MVLGQLLAQQQDMNEQAVARTVGISEQKLSDEQESYSQDLPNGAPNEASDFFPPPRQPLAHFFKSKAIQTSRRLLRRLLPSMM
jgi:hypothetical protein